MPQRKTEFQIGPVRCELELRTAPDGTEIASGLFHLPDGQVLRINGRARLHDCAVLMRSQHPEIGFSLGKLWRSAKKIGGAIASGKVLSLAAKIIGKVAPIMLPGVGSGISLALGAAAKLTAAKEHRARGNTREADALVKSAAADAATPQAMAAAEHVSTKIYAMLLQPVPQQGKGAALG